MCGMEGLTRLVAKMGETNKVEKEKISQALELKIFAKECKPHHIIRKEDLPKLHNHMPIAYYSVDVETVALTWSLDDWSLGILSKRLWPVTVMIVVRWFDGNLWVEESRRTALLKDGIVIIRMRNPGRHIITAVIVSDWSPKRILGYLLVRFAFAGGWNEYYEMITESGESADFDAAATHSVMSLMPHSSVEVVVGEKAFRPKPPDWWLVIGSNCVLPRSELDFFLMRLEFRFFNVLYAICPRLAKVSKYFKGRREDKIASGKSDELISQHMSSGEAQDDQIDRRRQAEKRPANKNLRINQATSSKIRRLLNRGRLMRFFFPPISGI